MRKKIALFMLLVMTISAVGCAGKGGSEDNTDYGEGSGSTSTASVASADSNDAGIQFSKTEVSFSKVSEDRLEAETDAATAVNKYLVARCYLDKFLQYDISSGNPDEYNALLEETIAAFQAVEETADALKNTASALEAKEESSSYSGTDGSGTFNEVSRIEENNYFSWNPFEVVAYADEESEAVKWAKDLTERFDNAPAGKGIRTLAEQMGTDAKHAYAQLKQAQDILAGAAYEDFAETANTAYKTAKVLKTAGTAAQLTLSVMTADPTSTFDLVMTGGGILVNGLNTILEVGQTGSILLVGEDNKLSQSLENYENALGPIGSVIGAYGLAGNLSKGKELLDDVPAMADSIMYIGSSLYDYMSEGKILGGTFTQDATGKVNCTISETMNAKTEWAKDKEAKEKILAEAGFTPEEIKEVVEAAPVASVETASGEEAVAEIPMEVVEAMLEELAEYTPSVAVQTTDEEPNVIDDENGDIDEENNEDADADTDADISDSDNEDTDEPGDSDDDALTVEDIAGYYPFYVTMTLGEQSAEGEAPQTITISGGNNVVMSDVDGESLNGTFDPASGVATFHDTDGTPVKVTFTKKGGKIHASLKLSGDGFSMTGSVDKQ